jgi:hypothetical protein
LKTLAVVLTIVLVLGVVAMAEVQAKPFFTKKTNNKIIGVIKSDSDCWHEYYARATPKNSNHVLLNKETIVNNDKPDAGASEIHKFSWYYDINKIKQTAATNENKIRTYVTIELTEAITGETVTFYKTIQAGQKTIDFGVFQMHTDKAICGGS